MLGATVAAVAPVAPTTEAGWGDPARLVPSTALA
ncbi:hypothetical protein FHX42_002773 [Saccharopolyspora lacisalsi]|uniref:Uncharacterized protein n=1 Tax=Halosaccharopolyspora lacisalsi TaxID=1000566 RepID=A0A839DTW4_9PSEU|nr:hypothetical protein [Halosaccharopolyspora lacisalsi]